MQQSLPFFGVTEKADLIYLGLHADTAEAESFAEAEGQALRFLVDGATALLLWRRLKLFGELEALPGLSWFTHFEWDGKLYLLEEMGSRTEAEAILASCDDEPVALLDRAQMLNWRTLLELHLSPLCHKDVVFKV